MRKLPAGKLYWLAVLFAFLSNAPLKAQCPAISSSNGYQVHVIITPTAVAAPGSCQNGYNFNITFDYNISFTSSNIPTGLYTLQGIFTCNDGTRQHTLFADLPNSGGTGSRTTTSNPYRNINDCATATPVSLGCADFELEIEGPGIPRQFIICSTVLPVELGHFQGETQNGKVHLQWSTWSEVNNLGFEVQRATDADLERGGDRAWQKIGFQAGMGTTSSISLYNFADAEPPVGLVYYRLKQVDFDGAYEYSPVVNVDNTIALRKTGFAGIRVYPNPVKDQVRILNANAGEDLGAIPYLLHNTLGQLVRKGWISVDQAVEVSDLEVGVYYLTLGNESGNRVTKLIKQ